MRTTIAHVTLPTAHFSNEAMPAWSSDSLKYLLPLILLERDCRTKHLGVSKSSRPPSNTPALQTYADGIAVAAPGDGKVPPASIKVLNVG